MTFEEYKENHNTPKEISNKNCYSCMNFEKEHQLCCLDWDDPEIVENPEAPFCWHWNEKPWYS